MCEARGHCYKKIPPKITAGNFNPTFSRGKMMQYITAILGSIVLDNNRCTNTAVIYCLSTVISMVMLFFNTE
jgi:hypothetical protein